MVRAGLASNFFFSLPGGQINDLRRGYFLLFRSSQQFPHIRLRPLKGLSLGLSYHGPWRPSRAPDSPHALLLELQRNKDTVRCAPLGAELTGQLKTADANIDFAFVENALFYTNP